VISRAHEARWVRRGEEGGHKEETSGAVAGDQVNREVQGAGFTEGNNDDVTASDRVFDFALRRIL
jgi:hypothetical protein